MCILIFRRFLKNEYRKCLITALIVALLSLSTVGAVDIDV